MNEQKKHDKLTNEEVEYRIAKAVVKNVPDLYEEAANTPVTPLAMVDDILPRQYPRQKRVLPRLAAACLLLVLFGGSFFAYTWFSVKAILSIEVNPSVALSINHYERVIDARAMNSDGDDLLDELSLKGLKLETAMDALMGAMNRKGYLQDGGNIHLFVDGKDENFNQELYEEVDEMLSHLAPNMVTDNVTEESSDSSATTLSEDEVKQIALQHASLSDSQVTFHDLSLESDDQQKIYHLSFYTDSEEYEYTIDAISGEILSYDHDIENFSLPSSAAQTEESTSESLPQQKPESNSSTSSQTQISLDQAKQIALQKAGLEDSQVMWEKAEKDEDDGKILYELEFSYNHTEFNCEVDLFGNILKFEQETDD